MILEIVELSDKRTKKIKEILKVKPFRKFSELFLFKNNYVFTFGGGICSVWIKKNALLV